MASPGRLGDWFVNAALLGFFTPFVYMKLKNMQRKEEIIANSRDVLDILNKYGQNK
ncbi:hypothetical protein LguiA_004268 [Lonicera macranthoides]